MSRVLHCRAGWVIVVGLLGAACGGGRSSTGVDQLLRVEDGQLENGRLADLPSNSDIEVSAVKLDQGGRLIAYPGRKGMVFDGNAGPSAHAVAIGMQGEKSYWIVPVGSPVSATSDLMQFQATLSFSPLIDPESLPISDVTNTPALTLIFRGIGKEGVMGTARSLDMEVPSAEPAGDVVVSLLWNTPVDLDLHVVAPLPDGSGTTEIWAKAPGAPSEASDAGGEPAGLDLDSNASCQIDNRDRENVIWPTAAPQGHYLVRVDAFSLCGQKSAYWEARATRQGALIGQASGVLTEAEASRNHVAGAGVLAFEFDN